MRKSSWILLAVIVSFVILLLVFLWYQSDEYFELEMKKAYVEQYWSGHEIDLDEMEIESFGTYDGCTVAFVHGFASIISMEYEKVGPYGFVYPSSQKLKAYKDGIYKSMPDAYADGWLDDESVKQILEKYRESRP